MTAVRVVDDHNELANAGQVTHSELDTFVSSSSFLVLSSSTSLPLQARYLVTGSGVVLTDDPGANTLTVSVDADYVRSMFVFQEEVVGDADSSNVTFTLASDPYPSQSLMLYVNGQLQLQGPSADYTLSGSTVTMLFPPQNQANLIASYPRQV